MHTSLPSRKRPRYAPQTPNMGCLCQHYTIVMVLQRYTMRQLFRHPEVFTALLVDIQTDLHHATNVECTQHLHHRQHDLSRLQLRMPLASMGSRHEDNIGIVVEMWRTLLRFAVCSRHPRLEVQRMLFAIHADHATTYAAELHRLKVLNTIVAENLKAIWHHE
jgi:hypothetical protein